MGNACFDLLGSSMADLLIITSFTIDKSSGLCLLILCWRESLHLIPIPVDRTSANAWLYKHPWITCQRK